MAIISEKEISRQFRVLDQTLSMHAMLKERFAKRALALDIILLACSVIFCATTFTSNDVFNEMGLPAQKIQYVLRVVSVLAFFTSIVALRVNWKGKSARHKDAVQKLTSVLELFRKWRTEDGTWPKEHWTELHQAYWGAMANTVEIPQNQFVNLKAKYLQKVEISKMVSLTPGCPVLLLRITLFCRCIHKIIKKDSTSNQ